MNARDFCFWLQGFFELQTSPQPLSIKQAEMVRQHLALVFKHEIDPSMGDQAHQDELNKIHSPDYGARPSPNGIVTQPFLCWPPLPDAAGRVDPALIELYEKLKSGIPPNNIPPSAAAPLPKPPSANATPFPPFDGIAGPKTPKLFPPANSPNNKTLLEC